MEYGGFFVVLFLVILSLYGFLGYSEFDRHKHNQTKATKVLKKINTFKFDGQKINYLKKIDPFVFEELLLDAFENKGYRVERNKKYSGDGGVDGIIYNSEGEKIAIQAKRYGGYINGKHIERFSRDIKLKRASSGLFIYTGKTSSQVRDLFKGTSITLIGGSDLIKLLALETSK